MDDDMYSSDRSIDSELRLPQGEAIGNGSGRQRVDLMVSERKVRVRVSCERDYGILVRLFGVIERHHLMVVDASIASFADSNFEITIVAQRQDKLKDSDTGYASSSSRAGGGATAPRLPQAEAIGSGPGRQRVDLRVSEKKVRIRVSCERDYGILVRLFGVIERHRLMVVDAGITSFDDSDYEITIVAQMEVDGNIIKENLVRDIHAILGLSSIETTNIDDK